MQVRRVWSRAARSLLAQRTRTVTGDGLRKVWRWRLGAEPNDAAVLEARQYLAADLDVEAIYFNGAHYNAYGTYHPGMWEPDHTPYDPHGLAKQRIVTTPSLGVEVKLAVSATWTDRAQRGRDLAIKVGNRTKAKAVPLARKGYRVARDRVAREQALKHLRRSPAPAPDLSGTHTVQADLTFTPEQGVRWETLRDQLARAGVLVGPVLDDVPDPKVDGAAETKSTGYVTGYVAGADVGLDWSDLRFPTSPRPTADPRRCIDPDNTVHLVHPYLALPLCGKPLKHEERGKKGGGRAFYTVGAEGMADDSRMCDVCARMSAALSEPPVDPGLWRSASPVEWEENNRLFAEALGPPPADEDADSEALRDWSRVMDREGVLHLTSEPFPASLTEVVPHCGRKLEIAATTRYFEALVKRGDPTPASARSICMDCVEAPESEPIDLDFQRGVMARLMHVMRLVDLTGTMHIARMLMTDEADLQRSQTYCGFESRLLRTRSTEVYQSAAQLYEPTPAGAVRICRECARQRQPEVYHQLMSADVVAPVVQAQEEVPTADPEPTRPDSSPELDDGDEMPVLLVTFDAKVYLPKLMVEAGMVTSQKNGARLINSGQVTIDGKPCVGKLTYRPVELVGFVVELGGPNTTGSLPRIYESMTRRFRVLMA